jgi:hypothetical protein
MVTKASFQTGSRIISRSNTGLRNQNRNKLLRMRSGPIALWEGSEDENSHIQGRRHLGFQSRDPFPAIPLVNHTSPTNLREISRESPRISCATKPETATPDWLTRSLLLVVNSGILEKHVNC